MRRDTRPRQAGFTLLEALIALLVLAVGLLGLAGLQLRGLSYNHDAFVRSQATFYAYDLMERMRIRMLKNTTDGAKNAAMDSFVTFDFDPDVACDRTASTIAGELTCWYADVAASLPGASGDLAPSIERVAGGGTVDPTDDQFALTIFWLDRTRTPADAADPDDPAYVRQVWTFQL